MPVGFIGRKQSVDFRTTTLETWKKVIPADRYVIKEQAKEIILDGRVKIMFGGLDSKDTINKFNSAELAFFALDQAEETEREDVSVLRGALRLKHNNVQPVYKELYTANPADCWLKTDFIDNPTDSHCYVPALPTDNPHLPNDYIATLNEAFKYNPPLLKAYRDGDWTSLKSSNALFNDEMLEACKTSLTHFNGNKKVIACDPATSHDECVIQVIHNNRVLESHYFSTVENEMIIAGHINAIAERLDIRDAVVDSIGLGAGICGRLEEVNKVRVHRFNSSERSKFDDKYTNRRAEAYWTLMKKVQEKRVPYIDDEETRRQLKAIRFEVVDSNGKIKIWKKEKIKELISRSPDRADCLAMGVWAMDVVEEWTKKKTARSGDYGASESIDFEYDLNPATV